MKATIKLLTSQPKTKNGYPVYLELVHSKNRKRAVIGYSFKEHWNAKDNQPLTVHPDYNYLLPVILEYKAKISKLQFLNYNFPDAVNYLFSVKSNSLVFFDACLQYVNDTKNGQLYQSVLNVFNLLFPRILVDDITQDHAKRFMEIRLRTYTANGVHTYMRTLTALFGKISNSSNPFKGIRPKKTETKAKDLTKTDVKKLAFTRNYVSKFDGRNTNDTINYYRYYWLLMFYLGGVDMELLARARYDTHVKAGRLQISRQKGGSSVLIDNLIVNEAWELLNTFDCKPYLVPIHQYNYSAFVGNFNNRFPELVKDLQLTKRPVTKSARYTFINFAQDLLIDERITMELVGHKQRTTHGIYKRAFARSIKDAAHEKIVQLL